MKKTISLLLALMMVLTLLTGCGGSDSESSSGGKEKVKIALWGNQLLENYAQYLCETFPDVEFEFTTGSHTPLLVPVFAFGPGAENFSGIMDNTDIMKKVLSLVK